MAAYATRHPREFIQDVLAEVQDGDVVMREVLIGANMSGYSFELGTTVMSALVPRPVVDLDIHRVTLSLFVVPDSFDWTPPDDVRTYTEFKRRLEMCVLSLIRVTVEPPGLA